MKELLDDIVDRISEAADQVGKKADEVIETQRIKNKIRGLEKDNRRNFRDLGRMKNIKTARKWRKSIFRFAKL